MKTWVRKTLSVGVLAAGALLVAPTAAQAEIGMVSWDNDGIANGTQVAVPIQVPVNVCGTGVGALIGAGVGISGVCANGAAHDVSTGGDDAAWATTSKTAKKAKKAKHESARTEGAFLLSGDNDGILNGTQVYAPIQVPINVCGTGVGVLGAGLGLSGVCVNSAVHDVESSRTEGIAMVTGDNDGIANGTQVAIPVQIPVNVCGTGVGVLGIGLGASGACLNGAAHDVDGGGNGGNGYDAHKKATKQEFLPIAGGLTSGLPLLGGSGLPALGGSGLPALGGSGLPAVGGNFAQGSQMNVAGVDPTSVLAGLPTG